MKVALPKIASICLILLVVINPFNTAVANFEANYLAAVKQVELKEWDKALLLLNKIDEFDQQESTQLQNSSKSIPYLPKFYAGLVYFNLGLCQKAEVSLISSLAQQVIKKFKDEYSTLKKIRTVCKSRFSHGQYINRLESITKQIIEKGEQLSVKLEGLISLSQSNLLKSVFNNNNYLKKQFVKFKTNLTKTEKEIANVSYLEFTNENLSYAKRLSKNITSQQQEIDSYHKALSQYIKSLNIIQLKSRQLKLKFDDLFDLRSNELLADDWINQGKLAEAFKKYNRERKSIVIDSNTLLVVEKVDDLSRNVEKAVRINSQYERLEREVDRLIDYSNAKINQWMLLQNEEKKIIYAAVDAFLLGQYQKTLDILIDTKITHPTGMFYKNLFISAAYFYVDNKAESENAIRFKLKAKTIKTKVELNETYFSPKFLSFYAREID